MNSATSNFISQIRQTLAQIDEGARNIGGIYWQASRICQFTNDPKLGWSPIINPVGTFAMLVTDEDLKSMNFNMTAQELGQVLFGTVDVMASIPTELADLIGKVRE